MERRDKIFFPALRAGCVPPTFKFVLAPLSDTVTKLLLEGYWRIKWLPKSKMDANFQLFCIMSHNFRTTEHKIVILVYIHTFACMSN